jgi:MMPL family
MFGLLFGNIDGMVQAGSVIGAGLLLDTFLVRTVTVPALAVLVGRANWWPILWGRPCAREPIQPVEPTPKDQATVPEAAILPDPPALIPDTAHGRDSLSPNVGTQSGNKRHFHRRPGGPLFQSPRVIGSRPLPTALPMVACNLFSNCETSVASTVEPKGLDECGTPVQRRTREEIETSSRLCLNGDLTLLVIRFAGVKCVAADLRPRIIELAP